VGGVVCQLAAMGTAACTCIICGGAEPGEDADVVRHVREIGWSVLVVPGEVEFAYTIGLWHTFRRPEVIMFGLHGEGMHQWLNACVERGRDHSWPAKGEEFAGVLDGFQVQLRPVHASWGDALFGAAWRAGSRSGSRRGSGSMRRASASSAACPVSSSLSAHGAAWGTGRPAGPPFR
jgi:Domain of unknown function (DUF4262)